MSAADRGGMLDMQCSKTPTQEATSHASAIAISGSSIATAISCATRAYGSRVDIDHVLIALKLLPGNVALMMVLDQNIAKAAVERLGIAVALIFGTFAAPAI